MVIDLRLRRTFWRYGQPPPFSGIWSGDETVLMPPVMSSLMPFSNYDLLSDVPLRSFAPLLRERRPDAPRPLFTAVPLPCFHFFAISGNRACFPVWPGSFLCFCSHADRLKPSAFAFLVAAPGCLTG